MSLLSLPAELRLRIYDYLPDLLPNRHETVTAHSKLTPAICRVNSTIRRETLPIYAHCSLFAIQIDDAGRQWDNRIASLLDGLGPNATSQIRSLQISRHWSIPQPQRFQGHVGFYVRIEQRKPKKIPSTSSVASNSATSFRPEWNARFVQPMAEGSWQVTTGTYPVARDMRGLRLESVELLAEIVRHHLHVPTPVPTSSADDAPSVLRRRDIEFLVHATDIVASHPISTYDLDQAESARRRRHDTWSEMEQHLRALNAHAMLDPGAIETVPPRFFTPY